jgi:hypothetical protein
MIWAIIGSILCVGGLVFLGFWLRKRKKQALFNWADMVQAEINKLTVSALTPANVWTLSAEPVAQDIQEAIDAEFANMFAIAARHGWTNKIATSDYTVLVFPSVRDINLDGVYAPVFKVFFQPNDSYDESIYDQIPGVPGGWTYAAEWVMDLEAGRFVIPKNNSPEYTRTCIHNGLDHLLLYHNDRTQYEATKDHSQGGGHPILT